MTAFFLVVPSWALSLDVGDTAPVFQAPSTLGLIDLKDYAGKKNVVLALYYADFTPVWSGELQAFQNDLEKFESLNTQVLGVSGDSLDTHRKFAEEYDITFPLISDEKSGVRDLYGGGRTTFLIDRNGVIRYIQSGVPDNTIFLQKIKALEKDY